MCLFLHLTKCDIELCHRIYLCSFRPCLKSWESACLRLYMCQLPSQGVPLLPLRLSVLLTGCLCKCIYELF